MPSIRQRNNLKLTKSNLLNMLQFDKIKSEEMKNFANELLQNGFRLLLYSGGDSVDYFIFEKDGKLGYVQNDRYGKVSFSTIHKACKECGTWFLLTDRDIITNTGEFHKLTIQNAENCANTFAPRWATASEYEAIKKYESLEEYANRSILEYEIISIV